jgi:hypothetical protein
MNLWGGSNTSASQYSVLNLREKWIFCSDLFCRIWNYNTAVVRYFIPVILTGYAAERAQDVATKRKTLLLRESNIVIQTVAIHPIHRALTVIK